MDPALRVFDTIHQMLPGVDNPTPLVRLDRLCPWEGYTLYAKLEWMNPLGSIKDRAAWALLDELVRDGALAGGRTIVEATSGNTGLSLAALASTLGYPVRAIVPAKAPIEKRAMLALAGAEVEVVAEDDPRTPLEVARAYASEQPERFVMANQYQNHANTAAHRRTTAPEIWSQTGGRVTDVFLALGTCGTAMGLAGWFGQRGTVRVHAITPEEGHDVPGVRTEGELVTPGLYDRAMLDSVVEVESAAAFSAAADLLRLEGLRAGPSSGLIYAGARRVLADRADRGDRGDRAAGGVGVLLFCDDVFKYTTHMLRHLPELAGLEAAAGG